MVDALSYAGVIVAHNTLEWVARASQLATDDGRATDPRLSGAAEPLFFMPFSHENHEEGGRTLLRLWLAGRAQDTTRQVSRKSLNKSMTAV